VTQPAVNVDQWTDILAKSHQQQRHRQQQHQQQEQQQQDRIEQALEAGCQSDDDVIHGEEGVLKDDEKELLASMGQEAMERSVTTTAADAQTETEQMMKEVGIQKLILRGPRSLCSHETSPIIWIAKSSEMTGRSLTPTWWRWGGGVKTTETKYIGPVVSRVSS
jgi:hypothetical protein